MSYRACVSDWNGTAFGLPTDEAMNRRIAYAARDRALDAVKHGRVSRMLDVGKLLWAKNRLEKRLHEYKEGRRHLYEVYEPFNRYVLEGLPVGYLNCIVDKFAMESADKVDRRIISPIRSAHQNGKFTCILSASYDYSIRRLLELAGCNDVFDVIIANSLKSIFGKAAGFTLEIYDKKPDALRNAVFDKGFSEKDTFYLGDSEDDVPVAEIIPKGNFIVPFLATDEFREKMSSKYGAFVPENELDLYRRLKIG